jgi:hypothetical protein
MTAIHSTALCECGLSMDMQVLRARGAKLENVFVELNSLA